MRQMRALMPTLIKQEILAKKRDGLATIPSLPFGYPIRLASWQTIRVNNILAVIPKHILVLRLC